MALNAAELIEQLRRTGFHDVAGTQASAHIPVSRALLNQLVAQSVPATGVVRRVDVQPQPGDRFNAIVTTTWPLVPPVTIAIAIEQQPEFPASPMLVLRWSLAAGLGAIASQFVGAFNDKLPPGVRLEGEHVFVDIRAAAAGTPLAEALPFLSAFRLHTAADCAIVEVELRVGS
jgi:hypothetical protein